MVLHAGGRFISHGAAAERRGIEIAMGVTMDVTAVAPIRRLEEAVVNRIVAGEVIQRHLNRAQGASRD
jgi:hypothetical protein